MPFFNQYLKIIISSYFSVFILRLSEIFLISQTYPLNLHIWFNEFYGGLLDLVLFTGILLFLYPIYYLFCKINLTKFANAFFIFIIAVTGVAHLLIIKYFAYQLLPLDIFLFKHDLKEIVFTLKTSNTSLNDLYILIFIFLILYFIISYKILKLIIKFNNWVKYLMLLSIPISIYLFYFRIDKMNKFAQNKSFFFYKKSILYFTKSTDKSIFYAKEFQNLYPNKKFKSENYPLIHIFEKDSIISTYFTDFDTTPNVVFLIMEGLNDDFVHQYHGADFMPFLMGLKDSSLYWDRCFTLGERSYAVVPSLLGGLPYGKLGFTLIDQYPNHLSLITILKQNGYFTTFYDGQGSWFHHKDAFFRYNNIDLIIDNNDYDDKFKKIIVGEDNFFWGYNDKDLYTQSLMSLDSLNITPRLDIYFSGSMHTPFVIADEAKYLTIAKDLLGDKQKEFYDTYSNYIKVLRFTDDALKDFFENYKKRADFKNTIFIITGDHPMTELPRENEVKKYHVPLIIYSDKLKAPHQFHQIVSHLDVYESILSLLDKYIPFTPEISTSLGSNLFNQNNNFYVFMEGNREIIDCFYNGYYIHREDVYKVDDNFNINPVFNDSIKKDLKNRLRIFIEMNNETTNNNKIISNKLYCQSLKYNMLFSDDTTGQINLTQEYYNLTPKIKVVDSNFVCNIQFDSHQNNTDEVLIIYELSNSKDSVVQWNSIGINETDDFINHFTYSKTIEEPLYFRSYIWNKSKSKLKLSKYNCLVYSY